MAAKKREQQVNSTILTAKYLTNESLAGNGPSRFVALHHSPYLRDNTSINILFLPLPDRSEYVFENSAYRKNQLT